MSNNKNGSFAGKGYYIALILCAAAIGITSYVYYRNEPAAQEAAVQETYEDILVGLEETENIPVLATQAVPETTSVPETAPAPTEKKVLKTMSPVAGASISDHSVEALSYNQTTRDWRTHDGIDLAAEAGAPVAAAADGKVLEVFEDDSYGSTVIISHTGGYVTRYSSLSSDIQVAPGDSVTMGQTVGYAGDSAIVESELGSHVHFSVACYGEPMNPEEFLSLGK